MDQDPLDARAAARVMVVAQAMGAGLAEMVRTLQEEMAASIPELQGDALILDLLAASVESNVETFFHALRRDIPIDDVGTPPAAVEYARRLAQRGTSSTALTRAYRFGQRRVLGWALAEIAREEPDGQVAFAAAQLLQDASFAYVDQVIERVVAEYEAERERWLANRNTVRSNMLATLLAGSPVDVSVAESALGYRLGRQHLGVVAWSTDPDQRTTELRGLEELVAAAADALGSGAPPLFMPQDRALGWAWIAAGTTPATAALDLDALDAVVADAGVGLHLAIGSPGRGLEGFRSTHLAALRAHVVATLAGDLAGRVTSYTDPGVRIAALLAADLPATRLLVGAALGPLAANREAETRLRETLHALLDARGSFVAAAERLHVHKNTVKYRVDRAVHARGRSLDEDRLELELALVATRWLGRAVLGPSASAG